MGPLISRAMITSGAPDVANAFLQPSSTVFGAAILGANYAADGGGVPKSVASSTLRFNPAGASTRPACSPG